tara:strand:- start:172 stop:363 length:192 start_codon:yes stop_codon:yes gene_type:complete
MNTSLKNSEELEKAFKASPFDDMKLFVEPNITVSVEACTAEVLKTMPQFLALHSGEKKAKYNF